MLRVVIPSLLTKMLGWLATNALTTIQLIQSLATLTAVTKDSEFRITTITVPSFGNALDAFAAVVALVVAVASGSLRGYTDGVEPNFTRAIGLEVFLVANGVLLGSRLLAGRTRSTKEHTFFVANFGVDRDCNEVERDEDDVGREFHRVERRWEDGGLRSQSKSKIMRAPKAQFSGA